jgi:hypothetical protein
MHMILMPAQLDLLHRLMRVAAIDLNRAYSASWSRSRLRTILADDCIKRGLQVTDAPAAAMAIVSRFVTATAGDGAPASPDLGVLNAKGQKLLTVDLHCGSFQAEQSDFMPDSVYNSVARLVRGYVDSFVISADADIYTKLLEPDEKLQGRDAARIRVFESVLPPVSQLSFKEPRRITVDDTSMKVYGVRVSAFGITRIVCCGCASEA